MERKVFIGFDSREPIAYDVAKHSILKRTNGDVSVHPLKLQTMNELGIYNRPVDSLGSTEFTFSRFWVPYLMDFSGIGIFIDCDFIVNCDIMEMFNIAEEQFNKNPKLAVAVCKHDYKPREGNKMDNQVQHVYPRKNWSSSMVFNCNHYLNQELRLDVLNNPNLGGKFFHRFSWLGESLNEKENERESEQHIGSLPIDFNWLSGEYKEGEHLPEGRTTPRIIHYTLGGCWFSDERCWNYPYSSLWLDEVEEIIGRPWTKDDCVDKAS